MKLKEKIEAEIKNAMLAKDKERLTALRSIKASILTAETEKGKVGELTPDREIEVLKKSAKQRRDSAEIYNKEGRENLEKVELGELSVIEEFLPKQMTVEEIEAGVKQILNDWTTANVAVTISIKNMGELIKETNARYPGQDGKVVSTCVRNLLS